MTTALVTGGFGFLGSHLVERLTELGTIVHIVDNLSSSAIDPKAFARRHIANSAERIRYQSIRQYFDELPMSRPLFDEIYHCASVVGPVGVLGHAGNIVSTVVHDTYRMMILAQRDGARLCDVSTSEIYGGGRDGLCAESDPKLITASVSPRLEYAVAKLACEVALINATRAGELPFGVIVRPFNIAGPRQSARGGFVLPRFIGQALRGEPLTVYGAGDAVRAFTHVVDIADGIIRATRQGTNGQPYNLGNRENRTTILELAHRVLRITGSSSTIEHVDPRTLHGPSFAEAPDKYPDAELAEQDLGWAPRYSLDDIVRDAVDYTRAGRTD